MAITGTAAAQMRIVADNDSLAGLAATWPRLRKEALWGLPGRIVSSGVAGSEADPAALLVTVLTCAGVTLGNECVLRISRRDYPLRIFSVLVTGSPLHRGTAFEEVTDLFAAGYARARLGGKSGELTIRAEQLRTGDDFIQIITACKKASEEELRRPVAVSETGCQRRLIAVRDFGSVLRSARRTNSPLSGMLSDAWRSADFELIDSGRTRTAVQAHVGLLGFVPLDEVRSLRADAPWLGGLCSQLLWSLVQPETADTSRTKEEGSGYDALIEQLASAIAFAHRQKYLYLSSEAELLWAELYPELVQELPGTVGTICALGSQQVLRLAAIYSLLDESALVSANHLWAAHAIWSYCQGSARVIFGQGQGRDLATTILRALSSGAKTQTDVYEVFGRNQKMEPVIAVLCELKSRGLVQCSRAGGGPGKGRPTTTWSLTPAAARLLVQEELQ